MTSKLLRVDTAFNNSRPSAQKTIKYRFDNQNSKHVIKKLVSRIPHTTNVAAWINADTGIGPSIASGNQICKPNCVDFVDAHMVTVIIKYTIK